MHDSHMWKVLRGLEKVAGVVYFDGFAPSRNSISTNYSQSLTSNLPQRVWVCFFRCEFWYAVGPWLCRHGICRTHLWFRHQCLCPVMLQMSQTKVKRLLVMTFRNNLQKRQRLYFRIRGFGFLILLQDPYVLSCGEALSTVRKARAIVTNNRGAKLAWAESGVEAVVSKRAKIRTLRINPAQKTRPSVHENGVVVREYTILLVVFLTAWGRASMDQNTKQVKQKLSDCGYCYYLSI